MGRAKLGSGGGFKVTNGRAEKLFAYDAVVPANTFIEFILQADVGTAVQIATIYNHANPVAVKVNETTVAAFYCSVERSGSSVYYMYGVVGVISGGTITWGTPVQAGTASGAGNIRAVRLTSAKVFITRAYLANSSTGLVAQKGVVATISGNSLTFGKISDGPSSKSGSYTYTKLAKLSDTRVAEVTNSTDGYNYWMWTTVWNISGTTPSWVNTSPELPNKAGHKNAAIAPVSATRFITAYNAGQYIVTCNFSGSAVSYGTAVATAGNTGHINLKQLSSGKYLYTVQTGNAIYGRIVRVDSAGTITLEKEYPLATGLVSSGAGDFAIISETEFSYVFYANGSIYGMLIFLNEDGTLTASPPALLNAGSGPFFADVFNGTTVYGYGTAYMNTVKLENKVKAAESKIEGIMQTKATPTSRGKVWSLA